MNKKLIGWVKFGTISFVVATAVAFLIRTYFGSAGGVCPGSLYYCPGVGCVSGQDKCFAGSRGGASAVFSRETFVSKKCPDGTRSDGPCLMEFPGF
jgi:hypothetical protein